MLLSRRQLLFFLGLLGLWVTCCHCDDIEHGTFAPVTTTEVLEETVTTERDQFFTEGQLTTVFDLSGEDESTTEPSEFTISSTPTTSTTTTTPVPRTHGRMVRFGGKRRMARPTTAEPQRKTTANSRTLLNRRGLFNPELRNRYLGRFRSTTTAEPSK
uniref:Uncharacterized protein n=1 Tax=Anopheles epiroticus TaxID=199890 RepID=A0A182PXW4_9DIPT